MNQHAHGIEFAVCTDVAPPSYRRTAANQVGFDVQVLTEYGWRVVGFRKPYETSAEAATEMKKLADSDSMEREYRVYAALTVRVKK